MQKSVKTPTNLEKKQMAEFLRKELKAGEHDKQEKLQTARLIIKDTQKRRKECEKKIREIDEQLNKECSLEEQTRLIRNKDWNIQFIEKLDQTLERMHKGYKELISDAKKIEKLTAKTIRKLENPKESKIKITPLNEAYQKFEEFYT